MLACPVADGLVHQKYSTAATRATPARSRAGTYGGCHVVERTPMPSGLTAFPCTSNRDWEEERERRREREKPAPFIGDRASARVHQTEWTTSPRLQQEPNATSGVPLTLTFTTFIVGSHVDHQPSLAPQSDATSRYRRTLTGFDVLQRVATLSGAWYLLAVGDAL